MVASPDNSVREVIKASPEAAGVLERFAVRFEPDVSLAAVADQASVPVDELISSFQHTINVEAVLAQRDWAHDETSELIAYIRRRHHAFVRYELPRLEALFEAVCGRGSQGPVDSLQSLWQDFRGVEADIEEHLRAEEQVLFPWLEARAQGRASALAAAEADGYRQMKLEHEYVESFFTKARRLTGVQRHEGGGRGDEAGTPAVPRRRAEAHALGREDEDHAYR